MSNPSRRTAVCMAFPQSGRAGPVAHRSTILGVRRRHKCFKPTRCVTRAAADAFPSPRAWHGLAEPLFVATQGQGRDRLVRISAVVGTRFDDRLNFGRSLHFAGARGGDDILIGSPKSDIARGGLGDDIFRGGSGFDLLDSGGRGGDVFYGGVGRDAGGGGRGADRLYLGAGNDTYNQLGGGPGDDVVKGGPGDDFLQGLVGNDVLRGQRGDDLIADMPDFGYWVPVKGSDDVGGGPGADRIFGSLGPDVLHGASGNDEVKGGPGDDMIHGGQGTTSARGSARRRRHLSDRGASTRLRTLTGLLAYGAVYPVSA